MYGLSGEGSLFPVVVKLPYLRKFFPFGIEATGASEPLKDTQTMDFLKILQLILSLAPAGINLTKEILTLIQEIQAVVGALPEEHQANVVQVIAKALVTPAPFAAVPLPVPVLSRGAAQQTAKSGLDRAFPDAY